MNNPTFSIIIPVRIETAYLKETLKYLSEQTFKKFEVLVITDKISITSNPAIKRNIGARLAKGKYLAFLDDDSYPAPNWLASAKQLLDSHDDFSAVCGPCLTPPADNPKQIASGLVWSSYLGSGGAGSYRNIISKPRYVDDFPSVNLIVKKVDFNNIHGFNTNHWPGEDTILCHDLVYKLQKKIYYHPSIVVYHHRREAIINHLRQITRYAVHRGNFARILPKTSLRFGYIAPSLFTIYLLLLPPSYYMIKNFIVTIPLIIYLTLLFITFIKLLQQNKLSISLLATITIPITHVYYGILFLKGFFTKQLAFVPHKVSKKKQSYLGG